MDVAKAVRHRDEQGRGRRLSRSQQSSQTGTSQNHDPDNRRNRIGSDLYGGFSAQEFEKERRHEQLLSVSGTGAFRPGIDAEPPSGAHGAYRTGCPVPRY